MSSEVADQVACTAAVLAKTPDAAVVSNLGVASYVLAGVEDRPLNFYLWNSMGVTTAVGLGVALGIDRQVTVLDGDGSTLMGLGALATVAEADPPNLVIVVWDNRAFATTGGQETLSGTADLAAIAAGAGLEAYEAESDAAFERRYAEAVAHDGAAVVVCRVEAIDPDSRPPADYAHVKRRFREAMTD